MKKNNRWLRMAALCLVAVLLISTVSASTYTLDLSGDDQVNVWDIQVAVNQGKDAQHRAAILTDIMGNPDELHPNAEGVYEIYTATGLYNMANRAEEGASFKGTFDGNFHTISNLKITKPSGIDMGFFAKIGYSNEKNIDKTMIWQDITNDTSRLSATEQQRRQTVVDAMYEMGTVQWTTSEMVTFTRNGNTTATHSNIYLPGVTYTGVPYVGGLNGSYDRFLSQMQTEKDDQGRYVTVVGLEDGECNDGVASGMSRYMGNNCIHAISWSWMQISPSRVANNGGVIYGGVSTRGASRMVPNAYNTPNYGILSTGGYKELPNNAERYPMASDARNTQKVIELNGGAEGMAEYFTYAHMGDALTHAVDTMDETTGAYSSTSAHARMIAADPVIIRTYGGKIDLEASYVLTHEQGDGLYDNRNAEGKYDSYQDDQGRTFQLKQTSWRINHKYTLSVLLTKEGYDAAMAAGNHPGSGWGYIPITMRAFTGDGPDKAPYYDAGYTSESNYHPVILPNSGWYYSNYWINTATMIITDADGNELYNETRFPLDRGEVGFNNLMLELEFPDSGDNLVAGQTYYCTLKIEASNGVVTTKLNKQEFVYNPAT